MWNDALVSFKINIYRNGHYNIKRIGILTEFEWYSESKKLLQYLEHEVANLGSGALF